MQLADIRILKINFHLNDSYKAEADNISFTTNIAVRHEFKEENNDLIVFVKIKQESHNAPFLFEVEGGGLFKFNMRPDNKTLGTFATINCPAIIFPYLRETIADITRRAGFPALHIAPVNFIELAKQSKKQVAQKKKVKK